MCSRQLETIIFAFLVLTFLKASTQPTFARTSDGKCVTESECQEDITKAQAMLDKLAKDKNTLSNQIQIIDSQINLTTLKISQSQKTIASLEVEIDKLSTKIDELNDYLNRLSVLFLNQVQESYKLSKRMPDIALFTQNNFTSIVSQFKYLKTIQKINQDSLINMETARTNFDLQKQEKTQKQAQLDELKKSLTTQSASLNKQKSAKNSLLAVTKNDEKKYEQLLNEAISQLNAIKSFSSSAGGSTCLSSSPGTGSDGNFYSQRDPKWCKNTMGRSSDTIGAVGCYISSISMAFKKLGYNTSPPAYAADPSNFRFNTAYAVNPDPPAGYTYKQVSYSASTVDKELSANRYVIAQIRMSGTVSGMHFIVLISGSGGKYKMHDPWYGADLDFSSHYSTSSIMSLRLITK